MHLLRIDVGGGASDVVMGTLERQSVPKFHGGDDYAEFVFAFATVLCGSQER